MTADCAREVNLYLRAKVDFCNCATGLADDEVAQIIGNRYEKARESAHRLFSACRTSILNIRMASNGFRPALFFLSSGVSAT